MNGTSYLSVKALHVIAVIAWYAGLFYIFRLYVYHVQKRAEPAVTATLEVMERRLIRAIMTPAMVVALGAGVVMLIMNPSLLKMPWMHAKLGFVVALLAYHLFCYRLMGQLRQSKNQGVTLGQAFNTDEGT